MKVKVVKRCRKKWNEHNMMYIYHKQCEIKQKNHWNSSNGQIHWFPIDFLWKWSIMDQNYANANAFFSDWKIFLRYPGYAIGKLTSRAFWKCGGFCCYNFLNGNKNREYTLRCIIVDLMWRHLEWERGCLVVADKGKVTPTRFKLVLHSLPIAP